MNDSGKDKKDTLGKANGKKMITDWAGLSVYKKAPFVVGCIAASMVFGLLIVVFVNTFILE